MSQTHRYNRCERFERFVAAGAFRFLFAGVTGLKFQRSLPAEYRARWVMKIAIIGSGISGLVAAHRLNARHDITVFEANDYVGGHTNTVDAELDGERHAIDTGFIVYNDWTYPNFSRLLDELSIESQATTMSFSVRDERANLEYNGHSLGTLFAQRRNLLRPSFFRMLADIWRFNRQASRLVADPEADISVGEFLAQHHYSRPFTEHYLLPMGAAIWSCPSGTFANFPIRFIVEFFHNHGLLSLLRRPTWRVVSGGSRTYVRALAANFLERIRLRTAVCSVYRTGDRVAVRLQSGDGECFDHVIFACHSDQALRILGEDATRAELEVLSAFPYERNVAVLHTDISVLPRRRSAWASWNYRMNYDDSGRTPASVTYNMNLLQGIRSRNTFCVTLNNESQIAPAKVLRRFEYHHPVFTTGRAAAQARHGELLASNGRSFCGAYWGNGFHEDGVNSALAVAAALDQPLNHALPSTAGLKEVAA